MALEPDAAQLQQLGLYDPASADAESRLELIRYALSRGASLDEVVAAGPHLGELVLDHSLRPERPTALGDAVAAAGLDWPSAQRLLISIGLPTDPTERLTADEATVVRMLAVASRELLGEPGTAQLARVTASVAARLAETLVGLFRLQLELPRQAAGTPYVQVVTEYSEVAEAMLPSFVRTLDALLRRQLSIVAQRMWSTDDERSTVTMLRTVGFADLVGYSSAAASMSVGELANALLDFDERCATIVVQHNGQLVKTIGDEVMFVTEEAIDACRIATALVRSFGQGDLPPVRVGLAAGDVVSVLGDVYGPVVNLAARLVGAADPSTVVVSESVHAAVDRVMPLSAIGPLTLKGFSDPVAAYRITDDH